MVWLGLKDFYLGMNGQFANEMLVIQGIFKGMSGLGMGLLGLLVVGVAELLTVFVTIEINTRKPTQGS